jgi:hypothetical protein
MRSRKAQMSKWVESGGYRSRSRPSPTSDPKNHDHGNAGRAQRADLLVYSFISSSALLPADNPPHKHYRRIAQLPSPADADGLPWGLKQLELSDC